MLMPLRLAVLLDTQGVESMALAAFERAGIDVVRQRSAAALVKTLHAGSVDSALIEDAGVLVRSCLDMLRFRGANTVPVIAIGPGVPMDIARALRDGVDDYAIIDEGPELLANRVRARVALEASRRKATSQQLGDWMLHAQTRLLRCGDCETKLTPREFAMAWALFRKAGLIVNRSTLALQVWGAGSPVAHRTIEQYIYSLRRKLAAARGSCLRIQTVHNIGYRLECTS